MDKKLIIFIVIVIAVIIAVYFFLFKAPPAPGDSTIVEKIKAVVSQAAPANNTGIDTSVPTSPVNPATPESIATAKIPDIATARKDGVKAYNTNGSVRKVVAKNMYIGSITSIVGRLINLTYSDGAKGYAASGDVVITYKK